MFNYIIITPAHNEEDFIENTIRSVIAQTVRPQRWVIVNDASTDRTASIIEQYASDYEFIQAVHLERPPERNFGKKAEAFHAGFSKIAGTNYAFIGNLDADISLEPDYFESVLNKFVQDPGLGIGGGMVHSCIKGDYISQEVSLDSVAGAVQLFRKKCFEQIGGYMPLPYGGIDSAAEIKARMHGWKVRTFPEMRVMEHRRTGSATASPLAAKIKEGRRFYSLGYGFMFMLVRCIYRIAEPPGILGSVAALFGYLNSALHGEPAALPPDAVRFLRNEQGMKLRRILWPNKA